MILTEYKSTTLNANECVVYELNEGMTEGWAQND